MHLTATPFTPQRLDAAAAQSVRVKVEGTGPVSQRQLVPVTGAAVDAMRTPEVLESMRDVLRLVEQEAGGAAASSDVRFDGISLANDDLTLGANTYRGKLDTSASIQQELAGMRKRDRPAALAVLAQRDGAAAVGMRANVTAGWMNLGPSATRVLFPSTVPNAGMASLADAADAVRTVLHEAIHMTDHEPANLSAKGMAGMWEAMAELRSTELPQLQAARAVLGLDHRVTDAALVAATTKRPYAAVENILKGAMHFAGFQPGAIDTRALATLSARDAVDVLVQRVAANTGETQATARVAIDDAFAGAMG